MNGKWVGIALLLCAAFAGGGLYYLQVFGFYDRVAAEPGREVLLSPAGDHPPEPILVREFEAIDADSSPIRYRACFTTDETIDALSARYVRLPDAEPRNAPFWFSCFDARAIGQGIEEGTVSVFLGVKNHAYGVDRLVAIDAQGQGWVWHELNDCGKKAYDGTVVGEACPER